MNAPLPSNCVDGASGGEDPDKDVHKKDEPTGLFKKKPQAKLPAILRDQDWQVRCRNLGSLCFRVVFRAEFDKYHSLEAFK